MTRLVGCAPRLRVQGACSLRPQRLCFGSAKVKSRDAAPASSGRCSEASRGVERLHTAWWLVASEVREKLGLWMALRPCWTAPM